jgi:hypothetical protein
MGHFKSPPKPSNIETAVRGSCGSFIAAICIMEACELVISDIVPAASRIASVFGYHAAKTVSCTPAFADLHAYNGERIPVV